MLLYKNPKLGVWLHYNHPEAKSWARGLEQILKGHEQILDHYEQKIVAYQQIATGQFDEEGNPTFTQGDPIYGDDHERPVYRDGEPIYEYGPEQFELVGWQQEWGAPPTEEELEAFVPPPPEESPVTDVERAAAALAARRRTREDVIFSDTSGLVATCYAWLQRPCAVPGGGTDTKTASQALQAGQGLCSTQGYSVALRAWIDFAAPDFYQAMSSPDNTRPWLEWVPEGEPKSIREAILDRVYLATYGVARFF